jgi:hypothetical protein
VKPLLIAASLILSAVPAAATVVIVNPVYGGPGSGRFVPVSAGAGIYGVELRGGNGQTNGDWEIGVGRQASVTGGFNQGQLSWGCVATAANPQTGCGTVLPFTLSWSADALSVTVGGVTVSSPTGPGLAGLNGDTLRVWAKRDASFTITEVDGNPFSLSATGVASGAATALNDFYLHSVNNWGGNGLTVSGTVRIAGGRGSANEIFFTHGSFVPEPASWAMLITGFGLVGAAARRRRAVAA